MKALEAIGLFELALRILWFASAYCDGITFVEGGVVLGAAGRLLAAGYLSASFGAPLVFIFLQYVFVLFDQRKKRKYALGSALSALTCDVPAAAITFLLYRCRNYYMLEIHIVSRALHTACVFTRCITTGALFCVKDKAPSIKAAIYCGITATWLAALGVFSFSALTFANLSLLRNYDPQLSGVSVVLVPPQALPDHNLDAYPLVLSRNTSISDRSSVIVESFGVTIENEVNVLTTNESTTDARSSQLFFSRQFNCTSSTFCTSGQQINFLFRYEQTLTSTSRHLKPYTKLFYSCATTKAGVCLHNNCTGMSLGWNLRFLNLYSPTNSSAYLASTPWQDLASCSPTPIYHDKEIDACGNKSARPSPLFFIIIIALIVVQFLS